MAFWLKVRYSVSVLFRIQLMAKYIVLCHFNIYSLQFFLHLFICVCEHVCVYAHTHTYTPEYHLTHVEVRL